MREKKKKKKILPSVGAPTAPQRASKPPSVYDAEAFANAPHLRKTYLKTHEINARADSGTIMQI